MNLSAYARASALFVLLAGCGSSPPPVDVPPPPPPVEAPPEETPAATTEAPPPAPPVAITAMEPPAVPAPFPTLKVTAPTANQVIPADKSNDFEVKLEVKDWIDPHAAPPADGVHKGHHVHVIIDNEPSFAVFDAKGAVKISEIVKKPLAEGEHLLVAFPSRETHISVKPEAGKSPLVRVPFWVGKKGTSTYDAKAPMLIYSRPKGEYKNEAADSVALDFYLANVELAKDKYTVHANVTPGDGGAAQSIVIDQWVPFAITNLPVGPSTVKLELFDKDGKLVPGAWNATERTITVARDAK